MSIDLPLGDMSLTDKLATMELLWADLSRQPSDVPSPDWHTEILKERKRQADAGQLKFLDWDSAIADLREELRGNSAS